MSDDQIALLARGVVATGEFPLAVTAWNGYRTTKQRGALVVLLEPDPDSKDGSAYQINGATYCNFQSPHTNFQGVTNLGTDALKAEIATYDPEKEVVLVVSFAKLGHTGEAPWFKFCPALPPPIAFAAVEARPSEFGTVVGIERSPDQEP